MGNPLVVHNTHDLIPTFETALTYTSRVLSTMRFNDTSVKMMTRGATVTTDGVTTPGTDDEAGFDFKSASEFVAVAKLKNITD